MAHEQSVEDLTHEFERLKQLLEFREKELDIRSSNGPVKVVAANKIYDINVIINNYNEILKKNQQPLKFELNLERDKKAKDAKSKRQKRNQLLSLEEKKLHLKEARKEKVDVAKAHLIAVPIILMSSIKKNFNRARIAIMNKEVDLSYKYSEYRENKAYEHNQKIADRLNNKETKKRVAQKKADFKAALKEQNNLERAEKRNNRKQRVSYNLAYLRSVPANQIANIRECLKHLGSKIQSKYGELYVELEDRKEEKDRIRNIDMAESLQAKEEAKRAKERKSDFKAAIKTEKKEERERRHKAILEMIKALNEDQINELNSQQEEISNLQSQIIYNMSEASGRKR